MRSRPLQWACNNVSCECAFSTNVSLAPGASAVTVHAGLQNARSDEKDYGPDGQELPAMYGIGDLHVMKTYTGGAPFSSAPVETLSTPQPQPPWAPGHIDITEGWACFVDETDRGWGFYSPRYAGGEAERGSGRGRERRGGRAGERTCARVCARGGHVRARGGRTSARGGRASARGGCASARARARRMRQRASAREASWESPSTPVAYERAWRRVLDARAIA